MTDTNQNRPTYEQLSQLESEFDDADTEILKQQESILLPLYKKRQTLVSKIDNFWPLVFESSPPEIDRWIQPSDSKVLAESLKTFEVSRFEIDDPYGSPKSFSILFEFSANKYFTNDRLEKKFWWRRSKENWTGLVSEPVKIDWKKSQDLTFGLTDAAVDLWQAKQKLSSAKDLRCPKTLPEYNALAEKLNRSNEGSLSFFTWFGHVSDWKYISAEESIVANIAESKRREIFKTSGILEEPEAENVDDDQDTEVFPSGDELAALLAHDIWPGAIRYFIQSQEMDVEPDSDMESEDNNGDVDDDQANVVKEVANLVPNKRGRIEQLSAPKKRRT